MSYIFLSHSSTDELEAVALKQWLLDNGWDDVFLDLDPERGLKAGERWQEALRRAADRCEAVVFIISPAWAKSRWCLTEFLLAKSLHKLIFGVVAKDTALDELPTELTSEYQLCHLVGEGPTATIRFTHRETTAGVAFLAAGLNRLRLGLQAAGLSASFFPWPPQGDKSRAPYRGLEPLDTPDAAVFFGRDAEILEGLDKLRGMRAAGNEGLFVILGASGAGKSSFLRAGLLPRLARDDRHYYLMEVVRPERSPLFGELGLAQAISQANNDLRLKPVNVGEIKSALNEGAEHFRQLLGNIQNAARDQLLGLPDDAPHPTLLLAVDQAEELFSTDATEEARAFLNLIGGVLRATLPRSSEQGLSVIIAFTIRSDRYEPLQTAPELMGLKTVVFDALKPMPKVQFKEVIIGPAIRASLSGRQLEVKPDLVQQLLDDCDQGGDTLPLLSLALSRLYRDYGSDGDLSLAEYQSMGGMTNVITNEIELICAADPQNKITQLEALHAAFVPWLATINPDNDQPMRRLARMSDLPPASHTLVQALIEKRLLVSDMRNGEQVVEVAHESLLRQWEILAQWLEEEREDLKEADRLEQAVAAWNRSGKKADWLMEGERLIILETLTAKPGYRRRLESTGEFLLCSRQRETQRKEEEEHHRQAELVAAQEKQKAAQEKQAAAEAFAASSRRKTRVATTAFGLAMVFLLIAATAALWANQQRKNALEGELASVAESLALERPEQSVLLGLAARDVSATPKVEAFIRFARANYSYKRTLQGHTEPVMNGEFSPNGKMAVTASKDKTARLWDTTSGIELKVLSGHEDAVVSAEFSRDGGMVVTASWDNTARIWDVEKGNLLWTLKKHDHPLEIARFSRDGKMVVTASRDKTARLWNVANGEELCVLSGHTDTIFSARFSPDGKTVATASEDGTVRLWDVVCGKEPWKLEHKSRNGGRLSSVSSAQFSPDGKILVTADDDGSVRLWNVGGDRKPAVLRVLSGHTSGVNNARFSPDGEKVVTASNDGTARLWDVNKGKELERFNHQGQVYDAKFSHDHGGERLVTASEDNVARLWDQKSGRILQTLRGHQGPVHSVQFSPNDDMLLTTSDDETARLWDTARGQKFLELVGHEDSLMTAQFSPADHGKTVVTASRDWTARLWDVASGKEKEMFSGHEGRVNSAAFSPDGKMVVTASKDKTARLWEVGSGGEPRKLLGHEEAINSAEFSRDGKLVVTASEDRTARVWDVANGKEKGKLLLHKEAVNSAAFSPDGEMVVTASDDKIARLWDVANRREKGKLEGHKREVNSARFSHDGKMVVTAGKDRTARLWDLASGRELRVLHGHKDAIHTAEFSPDSKTVVTAGQDETVRLWDTASGRELQALRGYKGPVKSAQFSPDGQWVLTATGDKTAGLWRCDVCTQVCEIADELARAVGRELSAEERVQFGVQNALPSSHHSRCSS